MQVHMYILTFAVSYDPLDSLERYVRLVCEVFSFSKSVLSPDI